MVRHTVVIRVQERHRVPLIKDGKEIGFTTEYGEWREHLVDVDVDVESIAQALGEKAVTRRSGKATGLGGRVVVRVRSARKVRG